MGVAPLPTDPAFDRRAWLPLRLLNGTSLDAPIVAASWFVLLTVGQDESIDASLTRDWNRDTLTLAVLSMTVWLIYSGDRLLDLRRLDFNRAVSPQHRFANRWKVPMVAAWLIVLAVDAVVTLVALPREVVVFGMGLLVIVVVYMLVAHVIEPLRRKLPKEIFVGFIFACGVAGPLAAQARLADWPQITGFLAGLFSMNCLLVSIVQERIDREQTTPSLTVAWPAVRKRLPVCGWILMSLVAVSMLGGRIQTLPAAAIIISLAATVRLMLVALRRRDRPVWISYAADLVLMVVPAFFSCLASIG